MKVHSCLNCSLLLGYLYVIIIIILISVLHSTVNMYQDSYCFRDFCFVMTQILCCRGKNVFLLLANL